MRLFMLFLFCLINIAPFARAQDSQIISRHSDWTVYKAKTDDGEICFVASTPKDFSPKKVNRGDIFFYITNWPKYKVRQEVSVKLGYPIKTSSKLTVSIGSKNFSLFEKGNRAYIHPSLEASLIKNMKLGEKMLIKGTSQRGTDTTDVYSLMGITAALSNLKKACK